MESATRGIEIFFIVFMVVLSERIRVTRDAFGRLSRVTQEVRGKFPTGATSLTGRVANDRVLKIGSLRLGSAGIVCKANDPDLAGMRTFGTIWWRIAISPGSRQQSSCPDANVDGRHNTTTTRAIAPKRACTIVPFLNVAAPNRPATIPPANNAI